MVNYQITRRHILEDSTLLRLRHKNPKSNTTHTTVRFQSIDLIEFEAETAACIDSRQRGRDISNQNLT
jgi:hypothetical protein